MTTMDTKGREYVANFPLNISNRTGISPEYIEQAAQRIGITIDGTAALHGEYIPAVGALTPEQARQIVANMFAIKDEIRARRATNCHYCGLPLRGGQCDECV